jgi:hypothetical protein
MNRADIDTGNSSSTTLPSGRKLRLITDNGHEELILEAPNGELELRILLTEDGPILKLSAARLELEATDSISMKCKTFDLLASESASLTSEGALSINSNDELTVNSDDDVRVTGKIIHLN